MTVNIEGFFPNLETHPAPVLATQIKSELLASKSEATGQIEGANGTMYFAKKAHHPLLLQVASHSLILLAAPML
jgi:aspartyl aminopeptidase